MRFVTSRAPAGCRQQKSFLRVRASFGSQMDVETIQKGKVYCYVSFFL